MIGPVVALLRPDKSCEENGRGDHGKHRQGTGSPRTLRTDWTILVLGIYWICDRIVRIFAAIDYPGLAGQAIRIVVGVLAITAGTNVLICPTRLCWSWP
jgi:hypothetical protein